MLRGIGDILAAPTIYILKLVDLDLLNTFQTGFIYTSSGDNSEMYRKALNILGAGVLLRSHVLATDRQSNDGYVKVLVKTSNGVTKLIRAKKIVISIPPKLGNLVGFDLSAHEAALFAQFGNDAYYTGLICNPGTLAWFNIGENTSHNLSILPAPYIIYPAEVSNLMLVYYGSPYQLPEDQVKADIISKLLCLQQQQNLKTTTPSFLIFSSHVPFVMKVSASAIAGGFYRELYGLQGQRQTYYTGAAFHTQDSALLWRFTEGVLPNIVG